MKLIRSIGFIMLALGSGYSSKGQAPIDRHQFYPIDSFVSHIGPLRDYPLRSIIDSFATQNLNQHGMVRAIYMWMARNIAFDTKSFRHPRNAIYTASATLNSHLATSEGYANLFKAMCDYARIESTVIPGYAKVHAEQIGKALTAENRHFWNAVKVYNTWYLIDVALGAGTTDSKGRHFSPDLTDAWMYANRSLFSSTHFPDNEEQQFLTEPVAKSVYNNSLIADKVALILALHPATDTRGKLRGRGGDCKRMIFSTDYPGAIREMTAIADGERMQVAYYAVGKKIYVDLPLGSGGSYPIELYINQAPAFAWIATVSLIKKR